MAYQSEFHVKILAADHVFYQGRCASLVIPSTDGQYGILANHANMVAAIQPGLLTYTVPDEAPKVAAVSPGLVKVEDNEVLVLVDSVEYPEEIDEARAEREVKEAREAMQEKQSRHEFWFMQWQLARALNRLRVKRDYPKE